MKKFAKVLTTVLVIFLVFTAVISFLDMPVAEEGKELTKAQELLVMLKTYLNEMLSVAGLTATGAMAWAVNVINKTTNVTSTSTNETAKSMVELKSEIEEIKNAQDKTVGDKLDLLMQMISSVFLASDMPATVRAKVTDFVDSFDKVKAKASPATVTEVVQVVKEIVEVVAPAQQQEQEQTSTVVPRV